ncbi:MAG: hypothetical protein BWZ03_00561 [bacterium ADurb.BinA186]|nr:MAG: hypothetical protein BWZ03_00561 [bacterium ADurb.BinA186]
MRGIGASKSDSTKPLLTIVKKKAPPHYVVKFEKVFDTPRKSKMKLTKKAF